MPPPLPERLLLVKLSSLGDVVHCLPLAAALRAGLGDSAYIAWAVAKPFAPLLAGNPHLSQVHILPSKSAADVYRFGRMLRGENFDAALDAQGLLVSGAVTLLSGARRRVGFDTNREGNRLFLTEPTVPNRGRVHVVQRLLGFCDALGVPRPPRIEPQTYLTQTDVSELLAPARPEHGALVGCVVGASVANKAWPALRWVDCVRRLADTGLRPVLLGSPAEADAARAITDAARGAVALDLCGRTSLLELAAVLAHCAVVVGGDSGATHLAVAVGTPVVGLYGVTDPARTGVRWGSAPAVVLDYAEGDAPPESRRARHPTLADGIARIPAAAAVAAVAGLLADVARTGRGR